MENCNSYYIYEIVNLVNGKTYRGQHKSNKKQHELIENPYYDKYMGSGKLLKRAFEKYGKNNFSKKILTFCNNSDELELLEFAYIACGKSIGKCEYNLKGGGKQTNIYEYADEETINNFRKKLSKIHKERYKNYTQEDFDLKNQHESDAWTDEMKKEMSDKMKKFYNQGNNRENKQKIAKKLYPQAKIIKKGDTHATDEKLKIREGMRNYYKTLSPEERKEKYGRSKSDEEKQKAKERFLKNQPMKNEKFRNKLNSLKALQYYVYYNKYESIYHNYYAFTRDWKFKIIDELNEYEKQIYDDIYIRGIYDYKYEKSTKTIFRHN